MEAHFILCGPCQKSRFLSLYWSFKAFVQQIFTEPLLWAFLSKVRLLLSALLATEPRGGFISLLF